MILLDTNVVSELMHVAPAPVVTDWLDDQASESVWTTAVTVFELRSGIESLPHARRRAGMEERLERLVSGVLANRVQVFDRTAAEAAGRLNAAERRAGHTPDLRDIQIAGITQARRATLATRNVRHFADMGIRLVNPWEGTDEVGR